MAESQRRFCSSTAQYLSIEKPRYERNPWHHRAGAEHGWRLLAAPRILWYVPSMNLVAQTTRLYREPGRSRQRQAVLVGVNVRV